MLCNADPIHIYCHTTIRNCIPKPNFSTLGVRRYRFWVFVQPLAFYQCPLREFERNKTAVARTIGIIATMKTLAIIPAYNEEASIVSTVEELCRVAPGVDYIIVNDGSRDRTLAVCQERGYNVLNLLVNLGLTAGFQAGMKYAFEHGYDYAVQFDADGQHRPEYLQTMVDEAEAKNADIVIGSRFVTEKKSTSARMIGSRLISGLVKATTGKHVADPTSGLRLYNRAMIECFAKAYDFGPEPDTVAYLMRHGANVSEVQVAMREREAGESYLSFTKSIAYMARTCTSILFLQWFR